MSPDCCQTGEPDNEPIERDALPLTRKERRKAERSRKKAEKRKASATHNAPQGGRGRG